MNMKERLARAFHKIDWAGDSWDSLFWNEKALYLAYADAALDELREPDKAMIEAGTLELCDLVDVTPLWAEQVVKRVFAAVDKAREG